MNIPRMFPRVPLDAVYTQSNGQLDIYERDGIFVTLSRAKSRKVSEESSETPGRSKSSETPREHSSEGGFLPRRGFLPRARRISRRRKIT